ncbi:histone-like transcription factor (CBF/NF-Y) [Penicillium sp. IBT 18751x]|nr:histone-like transcription factor (CBF/NF-Y) [Penicillium sp. IBT 18751x]
MSEYRPRSPDLSSLPPSHPPPYAPLSPLAHRASYDASPFFHPAQPGRVEQYVPPDDMARRSSRLQDDAPLPALGAMPDTMPDPMSDTRPEMPAMPAVSTMPAMSAMPDEIPQARPGAGIEVKTKFPVARIKRIMQADEDVGKVAQVTPIAVSKALELFMISLVTKAAHEAKERNSKRVTASHLKHAVAKDEVLDFLADIIAKVPDQPAGRKHEDDGSDQNEGRRKRGGRRPKEESD